MNDFDQIRPYNDDEMQEACRRVATHPFFNNIVHYLFPMRDPKEFKEEFLQIKSTEEFQEKVMKKAIGSIISQTSSSFSYNGFNNLDKAKRHMFIANHRDILLDAAMLQVILLESGLQTSEITFGSNLMRGELVIDIGKMNKMFRIEREGSILDFYKHSMEVSSYMRYAILKKQQSVWIAQKNGRAKDGNDKTDMAVLKMFSLGSSKPFVENLEELNITPIATSYEYEPCDFLKAQELYISQYQRYVKEHDEDLHSILHGITQQKGGIHIEATPTITHEELLECDKAEKKMKFMQLAKKIDEHIYAHYKLWPTNYIAFDLQENGHQYAEFYTENDKKHFEEYMNEGLSALRGEQDDLRQFFLTIYANPVRNVKGHQKMQNK